VYVNTVVAVLLGWALLDENGTGRTFRAMAIILGAVVWVRREGGGGGSPRVRVEDAGTTQPEPQPGIAKH
jgi:drug/metabolite transporter (DMT)-like permease